MKCLVKEIKFGFACTLSSFVLILFIVFRMRKSLLFHLIQSVISLKSESLNASEWWPETCASKTLHLLSSLRDNRPRFTTSPILLLAVQFTSFWTSIWHYCACLAKFGTNKKRKIISSNSKVAVKLHLSIQFNHQQRLCLCQTCSCTCSRDSSLEIHFQTH